MRDSRSGSSSSASASGIGFVGALQIVFIVLKLLGKISWSWLWVLSPTWISVVFLYCCYFRHCLVFQKVEIIGGDRIECK